MFSETRYARNGDLRVAYRASGEGPRDIVVVANWFGCCEVLPELPSGQGWFEAMTSLGPLIIFDQPGTGASDPVEPGALPTLEQWADSITAVLDDLGSTEAVLIASNAAFSTAALFAATHPSRMRSTSETPSNIHTAYLLRWTQELEFAKCVAGHGFCVVDVELRRLWSGADEVG